MSDRYIKHDVLELIAPVATATAVEKGDLVKLDGSGEVKPASDETWDGDLATTQRNFVRRFLGVSAQRKVANTATVYGNSEANRMRVDTAGEFEFDCASASFNVGDLVGPAKQSGNALENQKVVAVANEQLAIGRVSEKASSATKVKVRILSRTNPQGTTEPGLATDTVSQVALTDTATVTAKQLLSKILDGTPTGAATYTLPTAAQIVAAMPGCKVGDMIRFLVNNKAGAANTITIAAGTGGTADGTLTVAQNVCRGFTLFLTNVTAGSEAYFVYGEA